MAENENGQEKTEQPSGKRLEEATEKGDVAKSTELNSVAVIVAVLLIFKNYSGFMGENLQGYMGYMYQHSSLLTITSITISDVMFLTLSAFAGVVGPVLIGVLLLAVISNVGQVGFIFAGKALIPDFKKLSPQSGIKRMFSSRSLVEMLKGILKLAIIGTIGYTVVSSYFDEFLVLAHKSVLQISALTAEVIFELTFKVALALLVMAIADFAYQKYEHTKKLKMTKTEVKDETKQSEGDPKVKGKIKSKQQEIVRQRMMSDVPNATVVVTNPTHFAVALKYDPMDKSDAPKIVAKGKNLIAQKIKEIAAKNNVPVIENKPLARSLFSACEVGSEIPMALYQAVAEVLSQVFKNNQGKYNDIRGSLNG
ncbi:MAG: flagellar biosynthesis protein FlhB [Calditrichaeota bacterium]|nr:MAG: flagellar biosynthesis protein FlhB [Calditrichota bacterium]MBL1204021.1 flagellar biosynthesis protein FlhB [Calditrichota bacterium]NOG43852.1 flagellar biosynthesis protein FlhB [Calditrichota bacterium]